MTLEIAARIVASDGTTVVRELQDPAAGVELLAPLGRPRFQPSRARTKWMRSKGDVPYGPVTPDVGVLPVTLLITGASWAAVETLWGAIEADLWAETDYYIETVVEGVTRRYWTDVPSYEDDGIVQPDNVARFEMETRLRFTVQPDPATSITL